MRFNVYQWTSKEWNYLATVRATNETEAVSIIAFRYGLKGKFAAYPHIDNYNGQVTAKTPFVEVV